MDSYFPEYKKAVYKHINKVHNSLIPEFQPLLKSLPVDQHASPIMEPSESGSGKGMQLGKECAQAQSFLSNEDLSDFNIKAWTDMISEMAFQLSEDMVRSALGALSVAAEKAGNTKDMKGKLPSYDDITDMMDSISDLGFDEDGKPKLQLVMSEGLLKKLKSESLTKPSEEQVERRKQVIEKKKKEQDAQQRVRRLDRIPFRE